MFEVILNGLLDIFALCELMFDLYVLYIVYELGNLWYFTISVFSIIAPFYVGYIMLLDMWKDKAD